MTTPAPGSGPDQPRQRFTVFAASSLAEVFPEVAQAFEAAEPGTSVVFNFDGSQRLRTQLAHGASADVFASADPRNMDALVEAGLVDPPVNFAANRLAIIVPSGPDSPDLAALPEGEALEYLARPGVKLVLGQSAVPVGAYARESLEKVEQAPGFGDTYSERVLSNLVSEETSVRAVVQKVALGEADAAIVYLTSARVADVRSRLQVVTIPEEFNVTARYPVARLKDSERPGLSQAFIEFLRSETGEDILTRHGFSVAGLSGSGAAPTVSRHTAPAGIPRP